IDENEQAYDLIMAQNPKLDVQDHKGWTALHHVTHRRNTDCMQKLIFAGADITLTDKDGKTAEDLANQFISTGRHYKEIIYAKQKLDKQHAAEAFKSDIPRYVTGVKNPPDTSKKVQ